MEATISGDVGSRRSSSSRSATRSARARALARIASATQALTEEALPALTSASASRARSSSRLIVILRIHREYYCMHGAQSQTSFCPSVLRQAGGSADALAQRAVGMPRDESLGASSGLAGSPELPERANGDCVPLLREVAVRELMLSFLGESERTGRVLGLRPNTRHLRDFFRQARARRRR